MTGRKRGPHRHYSYRGRELKVILTEIPQRFEMVSRTFSGSESPYYAFEGRLCRLDVYRTTIRFHLNTSVATERGLWGRRWILSLKKICGRSGQIYLSNAFSNMSSLIQNNKFVAMWITRSPIETGCTEPYIHVVTTLAIVN